MSVLYIVSTPIGNLHDISLRALEILKTVDLILCEDTRVTKKLLDHYGIKKPLLSYHQHSKLKKIEYIIQLLREGRSLALVSDAGTPGISDPGNKLINHLATIPGLVVNIVPIPGPSALTAAASVSGFPMDKFIFMGFPPTKKKRKKFFEEITKSKYPVIFYESPYRIIKSLRDLRETDAKFTPTPNFSVGADAKPTRNIVVCRELTKKFETIYRGEIEEVIKQIENKFLFHHFSNSEIKKGKIKGEFVVVVNK